MSLSAQSPSDVRSSDRTSPDSYAVIGNPIAHSLSPQIHQAFARQFDHDICYEKVAVSQAAFKHYCKHFFKQGGKGLNITLPYKTQAFAIADLCSAEAERAQAVNTLGVNANGKIWADNTDGVGLVTDLSINQGLDVHGMRILILGAGGAVRGVLWPLLQKQPDSIFILNRSFDKAQALADLYPRLCKAGVLSEAQAKNLGAFDLVINATSASLSQAGFAALAEQLDRRWVKSAACYDMMYGKKPTQFMHWAQDNGARQTADGFGMLLEQAAQAYYLWRGVKPNSRALLDKKLLDNKLA